MADHLISEAQNEGRLSVKAGDRVVLRLGELPTTGFRWRIVSVDEGVVALESDEFQMDATAGIGGGGTKSFVFRAVRPGSCRVRLARSREWDKGQQDAPEFVFGVDVESV